LESLVSNNNKLWIPNLMAPVIHMEPFINKRLLSTTDKNYGLLKFVVDKTC
jgi:hypothetical protein